MKDMYDAERENRRLEQLCAECLHGENVVGEVAFYSLPGENQLDTATWFLSEEDMALAHESGFETMLLRFIDDLIAFRARLGQKNCREGRVSIAGSKAAIEWLPDGEAERLIHQQRPCREGVD